MPVLPDGTIVDDKGIPTGAKVDIQSGALIAQPVVPKVEQPVTQQATQVPPPPQTPQVQQPAVQTNPSIVDFLNLQGKPSDFSSRAKLAAQFGIQDFTGTAEQNTQILNLLRQSKPQEAPPSAPQDAQDGVGGDSREETALPSTPGITTPTPQINVKDFLTQFGNDQLSLADILGQIKTSFGFDDSVKDMEKLDEQFIEDKGKINDNPWLTEGIRVREVQRLQDKYEQRRTALVDRLRLSESLVGKALEVYQNEREYQKELLFTQLDLYNQELDRKFQELKRVPKDEFPAPFELSPGQVRFEFDPVTGQYKQVASVPPRVTQVSDGVAPQEIQPIIATPEGETLVYGTPEYVVAQLQATSGSKTKPVASEREQLGKFANVVALTGNLISSLNKTTNDPILGYLKSLNPYDFDARAVNAQVIALVPSVARALYGEVGVLTDTDIERYLKTLPNIRSTAEQNKFIAMMTLANAKRAYEQTLLNLASSKVNVSGFVDSYRNLTEKLNSIEKELRVGEVEVTGEDEAAFDDVVGVKKGGNYFSNLWNALWGQ